jgi:hypothetical protein
MHPYTQPLSRHQLKQDLRLTVGCAKENVVFLRADVEHVAKGGRRLDHVAPGRVQNP